MLNTECQCMLLIEWKYYIGVLSVFANIIVEKKINNLKLVIAHSWFNSYAPELVPIFYYRDKTRVLVFIFLTIVY